MRPRAGWSVGSIWQGEMTPGWKYYITRDFGGIKSTAGGRKKNVAPFRPRHHLRFSWKSSERERERECMSRRVAPLNKLATRVPWRGARNVYRVKRAEFFRMPRNFSFYDKMPLTRLSADCYASPHGYNSLFVSFFRKDWKKDLSWSRERDSVISTSNSVSSNRYIFLSLEEAVRSLGLPVTLYIYITKDKSSLCSVCSTNFPVLLLTYVDPIFVSANVHVGRFALGAICTATPRPYVPTTTENLN